MQLDAKVTSMLTLLLLTSESNIEVDSQAFSDNSLVRNEFSFPALKLYGMVVQLDKGF